MGDRAASQLIKNSIIKVPFKNMWGEHSVKTNSVVQA